jgi:hypothetical protein
VPHFERNISTISSGDCMVKSPNDPKLSHADGRAAPLAR